MRSKAPASATSTMGCSSSEAPGLTCFRHSYVGFRRRRTPYAMAPSAVITSRIGKKAPIPPSPSVEEEDDSRWRQRPAPPVGEACSSWPGWPRPGRLPRARSGPVLPRPLGLLPSCRDGSPARCPPPLGTSSKYWSPSVDPGGTVIRAPAIAGASRQIANTPRIAIAFRLRELPGFTRATLPRNWGRQ